MKRLVMPLWLVCTGAFAAITVPSRLTLSSAATWAAFWVLIALVGVYVIAGSSHSRRE